MNQRENLRFGWPGATGVVLVTAQLIILLAIAGCGLWYNQAPRDASAWLRPVGWGLFLLSSWTVVSWALATGGLFDLYLLLTLVLLAFHVSQPMLHGLGALPLREVLEDQFPPERLLQASFLVALCIAGWHLGGLLGPLHRPPTGRRARRHAGRLGDAPRLLGWAALAVILPPTVISYAQQMAIVAKSGYGAIYWLPYNRLGTAVQYALAPALALALAGSRDHPRERRALLLMTVGLSLWALVIGSRNAALMVLVPVLWLWDREVSRIPRIPFFLASAFTFGLVMPFVSFFRNFSAEVRKAVGEIFMHLLLRGNPVSLILKEFGGTLQVVVFTLIMVPTNHPFVRGKSYLYPLFSIVPNPFSDHYPGEEFTGYGLKWTGAFNAAFLAGGGGYGFSAVAEAFLNFGWVGAPLFFVLAGWLYSRIVVACERSEDPAAKAALAALFSVLVPWPRGEFQGLPRNIAWFVVVPWLTAWWLRYRSVRPGRSDLGESAQ